MTDAERMMELMRYASQVKVAKALGVSKTTTGQWARGFDVNPARLRQVEDLLRPQQAGMLPATNEDLLREMRSIRRLLMRQVKPVSAEELAAAVVGALAQRGADHPDGAVRKPTRAARRHRKGASQEAAAR